MEPRTIVAIEIASSKIKGGVAAVGPDGRITVLAVEEIHGINNVRYGRVQNIREVSGVINEIVRKLENSPAIAPRKITSMALALGGRSLEAVQATASLKYPNECEITDKQIERLTYEATRDFMGDKDIVAKVPRMFYVNNTAVRKAVGTFGETLRGDFMLITCGKETAQNLNRLKFESIENDKVDYILRPTAIADFVLSSDERELGCALVDFGAETTTVSVYKDGTLAFLSTIPMGSRLITLDLMAGLNLTEEAAENFKLTLGTLANGNNPNNNPDSDEINAYIRARAGEIAANIIHQIERSNFSADSLSKVVLVGGGAHLPEFADLLSNQCKMPVRVAEMSPNVAFRIPGRNNIDNIDIVALLATAARFNDWECLSAPIDDSLDSRAVSTITDSHPDVEPDDIDIDDVPESTPQTEALEEPANIRITRIIPGKNTRTVPAEDDPDLLGDDPDDADDDDDQENSRRGGFFNFFRRRKDEEEEQELDEDPFETPENDEVDEDGYDSGEEIDDEIDDDDRNHYGATKAKIERLRNSFCRIFSGNEDNLE